jgi:peptidylprolyl isomerase
MTVQLSSLALLAVFTAATAQTTPTPKASSTTTPHHAATTSTTPPNIPHVVGIPKTLYAIKYVDIKLGTGPIAEERKFYTVRYTGWLTNGTKFDSSYDHPGGDPITFPYGAHRVIVGWDTGFQGMHVGGKRRLFVPYQLAYGDAGRPPVIPAKADLIFDVELVSMADAPPQPKTPPTPPTAQPDTTPKPAPASTPDTKPATTPDNKPAPDAAQPTTPPHPEGC